MTLRITGNLGSEELTLNAGSTWKDFTDAVNMLRGNTGVYASNDGTDSVLFSDRYGSEEVVKIEKVSGTGQFTDAAMSALVSNVGDIADDFGKDVVADINGATVNANGNDMTLVSPFFNGALSLTAAASAGTSYDFTIRQSGLTFQLNINPTPADQAIIGISNVRSNFLGKYVTTTGGITRGGFLSSLKSGGENDLFTDPSNAVEIVDAAINDISDIRAYLGAFMAWSLEPTIDQLGVAIENLQASESTIRDLDFAKEMAEYTKTQIIYQAGISVIAQANMVPQSVLQLLQG
jgi:flagellin